jgi:hypothetical protein
MELNKLLFGGLALGCLAAAAGGGYLAARQAPEARPDAAITASTPEAATPASAPGAAASQAVAESEGVISPEPSAPAEAPMVEPVVRDTPRRESPSQPRRASTREPQSRRADRGEVREAPAPRAGRTEAPSRANAPASPSPSTPSSSGSMWEVRPPVEPERAPVNVEPEAPPTPAAPEIIELVVPADAVLGLQVERTITSETARVEDRVEARVTRDVRVGDRVAIPSGSVVQGSVMEVERGGKIKERARLGIRFHTVVLADGSRLNIKTESVVREGASPANESAAKIGGAAVGGAILGAILGGGKGAVIGGTVGAAGGTAATMAGGRNPAVLPAGTTVSVRVQQPVTVSVEK